MPKTNGQFIKSGGHSLYEGCTLGTCFYCGEDSGGKFDYVPPLKIARNPNVLAYWGSDDKWAVPACTTCINRISYVKMDLKTLELRKNHVTRISGFRKLEENILISQLQPKQTKTHIGEVKEYVLKSFEGMLESGEIIMLPDEMLTSQAIAEKAEHIKNQANQTFDFGDDSA